MLTDLFSKLPYMTTLQDRIAELMEISGLSVGQLAEIAGVSSSAVSQWKDGPTKALKAGPATRLAERTGYSARWIAEGEGPKKSAMQADAGSAPVAIDLENNPDYPAIRRVRFRLSAGASGFGVDYSHNEDGAPIVFQRGWYEARGLKPCKLFAVKVANGSMEPGLHHDDTVVVNTDSVTPKDGVVFAVNYEGEMVIKRLMRDGGQWWLASDNQDQRRYPRKICDEHSVLIGEIVHKQSERI